MESSTTATSTPPISKSDTPAENLASVESQQQPELPKLSASDFRVYNRLAELMDAYHNHFRHTWRTLYSACTSNSRPAGMSIRSFIQLGLSLTDSLTLHHTIEERYIFPELAERMPQFRDHDHLISQHEKIHEGLERFAAYLKECQKAKRELRLSELKDIMDEFGAVLWAHLDDEVRQLGAENMRKFWTKEEIHGMRW